MKKHISLLLLLAVLLSGCQINKQVYQIVYLDVFDTVTTLRGYDVSQKAFHQKAEAVHAALLEYHRLFDIYHDTPKGLKAVNDAAGLSPVEVDSRVIDLLLDCREAYHLTGGRVNAAMGSVLSLWHEAREAGMNDPAHAKLPNMDKLQQAALHTSFDTILIEKDAGTVQITDPEQSLDVGAIAKGWAAQKASKLLPEGYLLNLGGNICAVGSKPEGSWVIGVQSPDEETSYICTVTVDNLSAVTSGDYQRSYTVDGKRYHHIIDPDTLMPSEYWRGVTVLCPDSGLADCLSTALFLLPLEEGQALAARCNAEALWIAPDGTITQTDGFTSHINHWNA